MTKSTSRQRAPPVARNFHKFSTDAEFCDVLSGGGATHVKTVYALQDIEAIGLRSRWKPRKVWCTTDPGRNFRPGAQHVVKFRQGQEGTAALISEILCGELFTAGGIPAVVRSFVDVHDSFQHAAPYQIVSGLHFGTELATPTQCGPPESLEDVADAQECVDLWVFDSWVCNIDRIVFGNTLLAASEKHDDKFNVLAVDHSDCFCGSTHFSSGTWKSKMLKEGPAQSFHYIMDAVSVVGGLSGSLHKVDLAKRHISAAISLVPNGWWSAAQVNPHDVDEVLNTRAGRLAQILNADMWSKGAIEEATRGGFILNINGDGHRGV